MFSAMQISLPQEAIYTGPPGLPLFCRDLRGSMWARIPGVMSVGAIGHLPLEGNAGRGFEIEGHPPADPLKHARRCLQCGLSRLLSEYGYSD